MSAGNTTLGTSSTNTITANATATFKAPTVFNQIYENVITATQTTAGTVYTLNYATKCSILY
jgi:hypothetical protein